MANQTTLLTGSDFAAAMKAIRTAKAIHVQVASRDDVAHVKVTKSAARELITSLPGLQVRHWDETGIVIEPAEEWEPVRGF